MEIQIYKGAILKLSLSRVVFCVALLLASGSSFADPFEGFFTGSSPQVSSQQASQFIQDTSHKAKNDPEQLLTTLTAKFNWQTAAIRVYRDDWFSAAQDTRNTLLQGMKRRLKNNLEAVGVTGLEVLRVEEIQAGSEFKVVTLTISSGERMQWEWVLRTQGASFEILELQHAGQSLLK